MLVSPRVDWILLWALRLGIWLFAFTLAALFTFFTFQRREEIASYSTPKPESIETPLKKPTLPPGMSPGMMRPPTGSPTPEVKAEAPEGWREKGPGPLTLKGWEVVDGDQKVDITISVAGGDLTQNMNRWRGQVGLAEVSADEIEGALKPSEINGMPAKFIEIHQPGDAADRQSILGFVIPDGDQTWFIKLRGSTTLAERERERFEAFAKAVTW
jgi:hypothetical protein